MADGHPTPEQLYSARRGPRGAEAERHLAHAAACAECSAELARQDAFDNPEPVSRERLDAAWARFAESAPAAAVPRPARSRALPALALAAALAVAVGLAFFSPFSGPAPRDEGSGTTRGGGEAAGLWSPEGVLDAPPAELVFSAPDSEPRRVTVFDAAGAYRWTSDPATAGRIPFPAAERRRLQPGVEYFWTVLDGDQAARSFRIRPPAP